MTSTSAVEVGVLPQWNLGDLYASPDSPVLEQDLERAAADAARFAGHYEGKVAGLDGAALAAAIADYERLQDLLGRIGSYAGLLHAGNMADPKLGQFYQTMQERTTDIGSTLLFFTLELNKLDDDLLAAKMAVPALARYAPWLRDVRAYRPHQLSDEVEKLLFEKYVSGRAAWVRLYDETEAALRFPIGNQELT